MGRPMNATMKTRRESRAVEAWEAEFERQAAENYARAIGLHLDREQRAARLRRSRARYLQMAKRQQRRTC